MRRLTKSATELHVGKIQKSNEEIQEATKTLREILEDTSNISYKKANKKAWSIIESGEEEIDSLNVEIQKLKGDLSDIQAIKRRDKPSDKPVILRLPVSKRDEDLVRIVRQHKIKIKDAVKMSDKQLNQKELKLQNK